MKTCICTVIKNEHQYLDEWIKYHLDLGIDHIFIYEDIDSTSHIDITKNYEQVSLSPVFNILTVAQRNEAKRLKQQNRINVQNLYFKTMLKNLSDEGTYNWCFLIDIDEFITCKNLQEAVSLFSNYDAFTMSWECYGACNHINKPAGGVLESYPKKSNGFVDNDPIFHTKICFNLKTYKSTNYWMNHQPSDSCKWCRTDFSQDRRRDIFNSIYLRHYITKSWEEYIDKKYKRGYFIGISRTDDFFFKINPELNCIKNELMEVLKEEVLVILPYKQNGAQGSELELALSLWKKYCTFNYRFVVIGEYSKVLEDRFPWVEFIECNTRDKVEGQYNPHLDMFNKFKIVIDKYQNKYNGFIWMVDDNYAIKPFTLFDILQTHYHSNSFVGSESAPTNYWRHNKWKTRQLLDKENLQHINYTTHFPCWFDIKKLLNIFEKYNLLEESYVLEDIYFNYYEHDKPILDSEIRLGIWEPAIYENEFEKALDNPDIKFICNSVDGWSKSLENSLRNLLKKQ